jgi:hypothetical protein
MKGALSNTGLLKGVINYTSRPKKNPREKIFAG